MQEYADLDAIKEKGNVDLMQGLKDGFEDAQNARDLALTNALEQTTDRAAALKAATRMGEGAAKMARATAQEAGDKGMLAVKAAAAAAETHLDMVRCARTHARARNPCTLEWKTERERSFHLPYFNFILSQNRKSSSSFTFLHAQARVYVVF